MPQPLAGLLVLDFTTLLPGPLATLMLAEAGAEVVKIERPGGEDMRRMQPLWDDEAAVFAMLNRGKRGLELDLKSPEGQKALKPLLERCDVLVEQFRPGVMERLGLGYEAVHRINPRAVYCSISGYGQTGPRAGEAGHDLNYIGHTGLLALQHGPSESPVMPPALVADIGGGTFPAVINILLALRQRDATGEGCHLDIAMTDAMFTFGWYAYASGVTGGRFPGSGEGPLVGGSPRYRLYPTSDGKLVACGAIEEHFWRAFTQAVGLDEKHADDKSDPAATIAAVSERIAARSAEEWKPIFAAADCCATIVATLEEALRDPHFIQRGLFAHKIANSSGATIPALPVPIAPQFRADAETPKSAPALGAHSKTR